MFFSEMSIQISNDFLNYSLCLFKLKYKEALLKDNSNFLRELFLFGIKQFKCVRFLILHVL
jgi:hypothetical protein